MSQRRVKQARRVYRKAARNITAQAVENTRKLPFKQRLRTARQTAWLILMGHPEHGFFTGEKGQQL